jgi:translation initiation factor 1
LPAELDQKRILKAFKKVGIHLKKEFACNGNIVEDEENGSVIQLSGDQRQKIQTFLLTEEIAKKDKIKMHGF